MSINIDRTLTRILSDFCLDIAKAYFVATFITPSIFGVSNSIIILAILTKGLMIVILLLYCSYMLEKLYDDRP